MTDKDIKIKKRAKKELNFYIKKLANRFLKRNRILECYDESVARIIKKAYISAYNICLHQCKTNLLMIKEENEQLKAQIEKMKCCQNCKLRGAECVALEYQGVLCGKTRDKWELAE